MPTVQEINAAIRAAVSGAVYRRGVHYAKRKRVGRVRVVMESDGTLTVQGVVRGIRPYRTELAYDPGAGQFTRFTCTCPYGVGCKHAVALALVFAREHYGLERDTPVIATRAIRELGTGTSLSNRRPRPALLGGDSTAPPVFDRSAYLVVLHRQCGYTATLCRKERFYEQVHITKLLAMQGVTDSERALLMYLKQHDGRVYEDGAHQAAELLPLVARAGFEVCCTDEHHVTPYMHEPQRVRVTLDPPPIRVHVLHEALLMGHEEVVRHAVRATLSDEREPGVGVKRSLWLASDQCLVHDTGTEVRLYTLTPPWLAVFHRMEAVYRPYATGVVEYLYVGAVLGPAELERFAALCAEAGPFLDLFVDEAVRHMTVYHDPPRFAFHVEYRADEPMVRVVPVAEYAGWESDVSRAVSRSRVGRARYAYRATPEHDGTHIIRLEERGALSYIRLAPAEEIAFFRELEMRHEALGFTNTLKCLCRGKTVVERFLRGTWPTLAALAEADHLVVRFTHDTLPTERVLFTADIASDTDVERDWLHFDLNLYCGGERVTLEKLYAFMESGAAYWRKDDGTLVEVENRAELERLVRVLKSFRARRDGGFEGKLYSVPELSYVMTSSPHYSATFGKGLRAFLKRTESGTPIRPVRLAKRVKEVLRPYQAEGVAWLYFLRSHHFAGILADDMGLGKTLQALTVLARERVAGVPSIVVCPKSLLHNWRHEAATFFPDLRVLVYEGTPVERERARADFASHDLVVVSYGTLQRDRRVLCAAGVRYTYAVLDEAQYIKNHLTKAAQSVKELPADYRLALTGTPLENHVFEVWSIFDYLMPGFLGGHASFQKAYYKPIMEGGDRDAQEQLRRKVRPFMLRRTKEQVLAELPPKVEQTCECVLTDTQNVLYQQILADVRGSVFSAVREKGFAGAQIHILAGLTKLRQVCNHPALLTKESDHTMYDSAKLDTCIELIEDVAQGGRKVLVFSQFTGMLDILADTLVKRGITHLYLSGKTRKRHELIERFNTDPSITVFLISLKAGGVGLNLTAADNVILFDPWWNPSVERQAVDRTHRIGQTRSVNVYRLLAKGTIEEKIQALQRTKQDLVDAVVAESGELARKLTWEEVRELFTA